MVEVGPVHRYQNLLARPDLVRNPTGKALPHVDAMVAEQPVHLLDRMLGDQAPSLRQRLANHRYRQRRCLHYPERRARQRGNPLRVQVFAVDAPNKRAHFRQPRLPPIRLAHGLRPIPQLVGTATKLSRIGLLPRATKMRGSLREAVSAWSELAVDLGARALVLLNRTQRRETS